MEFQEIIKQAKEIRDNYRKSGKPWGEAEYLQGFMKDVGDLSKLIMARNGFREVEGNVDEKLAHELSDCLWSVIIIADELGIDLEKSFVETMEKIKGKFFLEED